MAFESYDHYENSLKKVIRDKFGMLVWFESEGSQTVIEILYKNSDFSISFAIGAYFYIWLKNECEDYSEVSDILKEMIEAGNTSGVSEVMESYDICTDYEVVEL